MALYGRWRPCDGCSSTPSSRPPTLPTPPPSRPHPDPRPTAPEPFPVGGETIVPIPLMHGPMPVLGFRFGRFAYCTDCSRIPEESLALLEGIDVLILDALRPKPHATHFSVEQAVEVARRIGAGRTYFTH